MGVRLPHISRVTRVLVLVLVWSTGPLPGQTVSNDAFLDPAAERIFAEGVSLYAEGHHDSSATVLLSVGDLPENRKTTAAMLMAGKALYAADRTGEAVEILELLTSRYPWSRYVEQATETLAFASAAQERSRRWTDDVVTLGVVLPQSHPEYSRPLFNGIRMAVEEHNSGDPRYPIRMAFRNSDGDADGSREAMNSLIQEAAADVVIGPLYSEEAQTAARIADRSRVPLVVPLATDASVSARMNVVFQANPTFEMRGRVMARHAVNRLRLTRFGVVYEPGTEADDYARGFTDEVESLGARVEMAFPLDDESGWYELSDSLSADTLTYVHALYAPVTGANPEQRIRALVRALSGKGEGLRLLGNGELRGADAISELAALKTVFTDSFHPDTESETDFATRYDKQFSASPGNLSYVGFDVAGLVLETIERCDEIGEFSDVLSERELYRGLVHTFDFTEGRVNSSIGFWSFGEDGVSPLR